MIMVSGPGQNLRASSRNRVRNIARQFLHHQHIANQHGQSAVISRPFAW